MPSPTQNAIRKSLFDHHELIREDFPILYREVKGKPLVYLDNAATTQKPLHVIEALTGYYMDMNANIHRGIHTLAEEATGAFEKTRTKVKDFLNASSTEEIIFTRGVTEGINLVAATYGRQQVKAGDEILISALEHHSNIVPWQMLCEEKGATLKVIPINDRGELLYEEYEKLLSDKTKLVAVTYVSNALGTVNPIGKMVKAAHAMGIPVLVDGAQATPHKKIDVQALDCDFFVFSGHKMYGPTGVGALYGKKALLEAMPPYHGGGEMIREVTFEKTTYNDLPYKFEAGTPNIADVVALSAAIDYMDELGRDAIAEYEHMLLAYATETLSAISGVVPVGTAAEKEGVFSFIVKGAHHQDLATLLDNEGVAVRSGHHCTMPLMARLGIPGTVRASFALYNTKEEIDTLATALQKAIKMLV